jgi:fucose permease
MKRARILTLTSFSFFLLCGFFVNVGGAVSGRLAEFLGTSTAAIGYCFSVFMIGRVIGILGNGLCMHRPPFSRNLYVRLAPLLAILSVLGLWLTGSIAFLAVSLLAAGIAIGWLYSLSNIILVDARRGPEKAFYVSVMNFLFSVGGVASPFLAGLLLKRGFEWKFPYLIFGALCLAVLAITGGADYRDLFSGAAEDAKDSGKPNRRHWALCAAIIAYILAEYSLSYWTPIYLHEARGKDPLFSGACVSAFWMAMLGGRFLHGLLISRIRPRLYLMLSGILAMASVLFFSFSKSDAAIVAAVILAGFFCSGLFPSLFALGIDLGSAQRKTFPTLMMLSAAAGSFLAMPSGSAVKTLAGIESVPFIPVFALGLMCLLILASRGLPLKPGSGVYSRPE